MVTTKAERRLTIDNTLASGEQLDGLIGMSFLSRFRLSIDYELRALRFEVP